MKLEVVVIPVSDVDHAKSFYTGLGWRLDADVSGGEGFRVGHVTPRGSPCSVIFGSNVTAASPGSAQGLHHKGADQRLPGPHPTQSRYGSFASFSDPDGNGWLLQEVTARLPGRIDAKGAAFASAGGLAEALPTSRQGATAKARLSSSPFCIATETWWSACSTSQAVPRHCHAIRQEPGQLPGRHQAGLSPHLDPRL
jgi:catechol 2,3-dioxygenase-like lactoylglutathione lyase family enzyme